MKHLLILFVLLLGAFNVKAASDIANDDDYFYNEGKIQATMNDLLLIKNKEIKSLLKQIDKIDDEIAERSDERYSNDMDKADASSALSASSQLTTVAHEIVRDLDTQSEVTLKDLDETILSLNNILKNLKKLNLVK